jgi:hypothetical protein
LEKTLSLNDFRPLDDASQSGATDSLGQMGNQVSSPYSSYEKRAFTLNAPHKRFFMRQLWPSICKRGIGSAIDGGGTQLESSNHLNLKESFYWVSAACVTWRRIRAVHSELFPPGLGVS